MFDKRRGKLLSYINEHNLTQVMIINNINIYYYTGFYNEPRERLTMFILNQVGQMYLVIPKLELPKVNSAFPGVIVTYEDFENPLEKMQEHLNIEKVKIGIDEDTWTVAKYKKLKDIVCEETKIIDISHVVLKQRMIKSAYEQTLTRKAVSITEQVIQYGMENITPDITEVALAKKMEDKVYQLGGEKLAFSVKVVSGNLTASPHGRPRNSNIENNSFVLFDLGVDIKGYKSDITRTFVLGNASYEMLTIYEAVKKSLNRVLKHIKPGVKFAYLDDIARESLGEDGYDEYFVHRLGHGLGLELHERPYIHTNEQIIMEEGMIFTIEPGVYIPEIGGVRIEENVLVTKDGYELLTKFETKLIEL